MAGVSGVSCHAARAVCLAVVGACDVLSVLRRAVSATLARAFSAELGLGAGGRPKAPTAAFRRGLDPVQQLRAHSWRRDGAGLPEVGSCGPADPLPRRFVPGPSGSGAGRASLAMRVLALRLGHDVSAGVRYAQGVTSRMDTLYQPVAGRDCTSDPAGKALSADKPMVFSVSVDLPWDMGVVDAGRVLRLDLVSAFGRTFALWAFCCAASYLWFLRRAEPSDRPEPLSKR